MLKAGRATAGYQTLTIVTTQGLRVWVLGFCFFASLLLANASLVLLPHFLFTSLGSGRLQEYAAATAGFQSRGHDDTQSVAQVLMEGRK